MNKTETDVAREEAAASVAELLAAWQAKHDAGEDEAKAWTQLRYVCDCLAEVQ